MPIYGYRCRSCNHTFEVVQSVNDDPIKDCPKCGDPVSKIFFPVGIAFKGSGFHVNDYKSPKRIAAEKSAGENGGGSSESSSYSAVGTLGGD
ncbi:MAG TPA: FmdB family zinc ribbon protein [Anaerolineae bacterium]|jgi:putative FmdB family regulatory protein|nr:FmdB family zinc ribbon protein [Anaerolineae bacterium]